MKFFDLFRAKGRQNRKKAARARRQIFRNLRIDRLEERFLLTVNPPVVEVSGTVQVANLAMAGGHAIPVRDAQVSIMVGDDRHPAMTDQNGFFYEFVNPDQDPVGSGRRQTYA